MSKNAEDWLEGVAADMRKTPWEFEIGDEVYNIMNKANGMVTQQSVTNDVSGVYVEYHVRHKLSDSFLDEWVSAKFLTKGHRPE